MVAGSVPADRAVPVIVDGYPSGKTDGDVTVAASVVFDGLTTMDTREAGGGSAPSNPDVPEELEGDWVNVRRSGGNWAIAPIPRGHFHSAKAMNASNEAALTTASCNIHVTCLNSLHALLPREGVTCTAAAWKHN